MRIKQKSGAVKRASRRKPRPDDNDRIFGEADLIPILEDVLRTWEPPETMEPGARAKLSAQVQEKRRQLATLPTTRSLSDLLALSVAVDQIEAVQNRACAMCMRHDTTLLMDLECARKLVEREHQIDGISPQKPLTLSVSMRVMSISIPDPAKDEITLDVWIYSGVDVDDLLGFMQANKLIKKPEIRKIKERWLKSDGLIGNSPEELSQLEQCFKVEIKHFLDRKTRNVLYNIGPITKKLWRTSEEVFTIHRPFKLSGYPFDRQFIAVHIAPSGIAYYDPTQRVVLPSVESQMPLNVFRASPPRGFDLEWYSPEFKALAEMEAPEQLIDSILRFSILLRRNRGTFVWRTLVPSFMVVLIAAVATTLSVQYQVHIETSMSVIPGAMIACAALQLTAAQIVPPHSGRTREDILFFICYIHLLLLYITLQFTPAVFSYYILWAALALLACTALIYFWVAFRPLR